MKGSKLGCYWSHPVLEGWGHVAVEANYCNSAKMLTKHTVQLFHGFELAPRPSIFTILDIHKTDVSLIR